MIIAYDKKYNKYKPDIAMGFESIVAYNYNMVYVVLCSRICLDDQKWIRAESKCDSVIEILYIIKTQALKKFQTMLQCYFNFNQSKQRCQNPGTRPSIIYRANHNVRSHVTWPINEVYHSSITTVQ